LTRSADYVSLPLQRAGGAGCLLRKENPMDRDQAELFAIHMLDFIRKQWPAAELVSLEVGRDDKSEVLWCKLHRTDEDLTHGGGYLFTVAYLERARKADQA
jgi:hypothetical protein